MCVRDSRYAARHSGPTVPTGVEQTVEVGPVLINPGGGGGDGGGGNVTGPGNLNLLEINGIGPTRAAELERNGILTVAAFVALSATGLATMLPGVSENSAEAMLIHARGLLNPWQIINLNI